MNFLPEKKYGVPSHNFVKKMFCAEKGDEITRFDGSTDATRPKLLTVWEISKSAMKPAGNYILFCDF